MRPGRPFRVTATNTAFDSGAETDQVMVGARLFGGTAASSAVLREKDASGVIIAELQCAIGAADETNIPIIFRRAVHVTLAGAGASCTVYV